MYLPDVHSQDSEVLVQVQVRISIVFRIGDLGMDPHTLEVWIVNLFGRPLSYRVEMFVFCHGREASRENDLNENLSSTNNLRGKPTHIVLCTTTPPLP